VAHTPYAPVSRQRKIAALTIAARLGWNGIDLQKKVEPKGVEPSTSRVRYASEAAPALIFKGFVCRSLHVAARPATRYRRQT
jgi:hypothetical protein